MPSLPHLPHKIDIRKGEPGVRIEFPVNNHLVGVLKHKTVELSARLGNWYIPESSLNPGS